MKEDTFSLFKDADGFGYVQKSGGDKIALTRSGSSKIKVKEGKWEIIGADVVSGINQLVWKSNNQYYKNTFDSK